MRKKTLKKKSLSRNYFKHIITFILIICSANQSFAEKDSTKIRALAFRKYFSVANIGVKSAYYSSKIFCKNRLAKREKKLFTWGYHLVLEDNFDSLNHEIWRIGHPWGSFHPDNLNQYFADSVIFKNGFLYLANTYAPKVFSNVDTTVNIPYAIGVLHSGPGFAQQYGYFEMRCKMPIGAATWPSFWLTGKTRWPPEIDIFENYGKQNGKQIHKQTSTVHWGVQGEPSRAFISRKTKITAAKDTNYHVYACKWTDKSIQFYTDGKLTNYIKVGKRLRFWMDDEMVIIINNGLEAKFLPKDKSNYATNYLVVDWIKVYKKEDKSIDSLK